jgi:hypothetical protein
MKTFLVIAVRPHHADEDGATKAWREFLSGTKPFLPPTAKGDMPPEGVWQIPVDTSMHMLAQLFPLADEHHIHLRLLLLDDAPAWIRYSPRV